MKGVTENISSGIYILPHQVKLYSIDQGNNLVLAATDFATIGKHWPSLVKYRDVWYERGGQVAATTETAHYCGMREFVYVTDEKLKTDYAYVPSIFHLCD